MKDPESFWANLLQAAWDSRVDPGDENWLGLAEEMVGLSPEQRDLLWECDQRTHHPALALALLELGETQLHGNRQVARTAAELVLSVVQRRGAETKKPHPGLMSLAADHAGQAFSLLAQLALFERNTEAAAGPLLAARALAEQGTGDPETAAAVGTAEALMFWLRGDGDASLRALAQLARLWHAAKEPRREALVRGRAATVLESLGRVAEAQAQRELARMLCQEAGIEVPLEAWGAGEASATRH